MFFFGHLGITAGAAGAYELLVKGTGEISGNETTSGSGPLLSWLKRTVRKVGILTGRLDYRAVLIGSILPDLIDKPVFLIFGNNATLSGRDYAHTLVFHLILLTGGMILLKSRKPWLLVLSLSSVVHLILDSIWLVPVTLFWPLLGPLTRAETYGWVQDRFLSIFTVPQVYIPELIGIAILLVFAVRIIVKRNAKSFILKGTFDW